MKNSYRWQLYITAHTYLFGIPFLMFPNVVLPLMGFETTEEPWIKVAGLLFMVIGTTALSVYRLQIKQMLMPSVIVRLAVCVILTYFALLTSSVFFYLLTAIIFVGVAGSAISYYTEVARQK
jgi:hypothetical protein